MIFVVYSFSLLGVSGMLTLYSPAKINLFLQILSRQDDGYHRLATLMQTIKLADTLHVALADQDELTCTDPSIPTDGSNLVLKAARLFREISGLSVGIRVHLEKKIPHQAGLGGGSSNAATTLWALNQLTGQTLSTFQLMQASGKIGSDIPFFFSKGTAFCTGRGEIVQALPPFQNESVTIVKPTEGLETARIYGQLDLNDTCKENSERLLHSFMYPNQIPLLVNDLEKPAFGCLPQLEDLKRQLQRSGFKSVLMSGSGSAFFCLGQSEKELPTDLFSCQTSFVNRSAENWYTL
ncbi:4-diphosphocytidyl-2-C-methyl-D-erythritol kinase [Parachlamydia acanthamoebae UV-7]|uniref:4-diphosphocytidyl-2-C-methyl-D-erythritol kinase n=2 Tax=Parachlamydia acanthamoebae TaxID=83552 RepID=F8L021_PARAV|nr:4-diphosphocytidyl-2-C-methyl-D-erythritol kinase [Parachlamydia acanthamoebae]CCB86536.1 4-diphosphocytidyl-2-C-methyl-D-erythritol kinase [Parachlamydia acanthamoebae UV-7]